MEARTTLRAVALALAVGAGCARRGAPHAGAAEAPSPVALSLQEERVVSSLPVVPPGLNAGYALRTGKARTVSAVYTCSVRAPKLAAREWVTFVPRPPELPGQRMLAAAARPEAEAVRDLSPLRRPLLRSRQTVSRPW